MKKTIAADHMIILWYRLNRVESTNTRTNAHTSNRNICVIVISNQFRCKINECFQ